MPKCRPEGISDDEVRRETEQRGLTSWKSTTVSIHGFSEQTRESRSDAGSNRRAELKKSEQKFGRSEKCALLNGCSKPEQQFTGPRQEDDCFNGSPRSFTHTCMKEPG